MLGVLGHLSNKKTIALDNIYLLVMTEQYHKNQLIKKINEHNNIN